MKIVVMGLGYIGLPTASMFANTGAKVLGVDVSRKIVETINEGKIHIEEPGLLSVVKKNVEKGTLRASLTPEKSDVFIVSVPTPNKEDDLKSCDLKHVKSACEAIIPYLEKGNIIIIESTMAPRSTEDEIKPLLEKAGFEIGKTLFLAHCPERVLPGNILNEMIYNNRIIGGITKECAKQAEKVYKIFVKGEIIKTTSNISEMSKLMENTYRDVNIALANELVTICNKLGINVYDVISCANMHPRVNILNPGAGVGGHCLAVDPYFIIEKASEEANLIKTARKINENMPNYVTNIIEKMINYDKNKTIAIFGVSYKPDIDDYRESPSLKIIETLENKGYKLKIYDPHVKIKWYFEDAIHTVKNTDLLVVLVAHSTFKNLNLEEVKNNMSEFKILDIVNIFNSKDVNNYGNIFTFLKEES